MKRQVIVTYHRKRTKSKVRKVFWLDGSLSIHAIFLINHAPGWDWDHINADDHENPDYDKIVKECRELGLDVE